MRKDSRIGFKMTEVKKHRQFWITISENYNRPPYLDSHRAYECEQKLFDNIHTIEISAVKELEAENTDLRDTLNKINNCKVGDLVVYHPVKNPDADNIFDSINQMNKEIEKLNKLLDKAVEVAATEYQKAYEQSAQKIAELERENKTLKKVQSIIGKYVETNPEIYADYCNDFGGSYSGQDIKKIRIESYKQGFFDCEMYHGPSNSIPRKDVDYLVRTLGLVKGIMEGCYIKDGMIKKSDIDILDKALTEFKAKHGGGK